MPILQIKTLLLQSKGNMALRCQLVLQHSVLPILMLISTLPLTRLPLPSLIKQGSPFSFMVLEAQARLISTTPFVTSCAHKTRLLSVLHLLSFLLFSLRVVILHIHASVSLFLPMTHHFPLNPTPPIY